jgi:hypothetical protein
MLDVSSALKSDCSGLFGFTASVVPATAVRLTGTDILGDAGRETEYEKSRVYDVHRAKGVHASKYVFMSDIGEKSLRLNEPREGSMLLELAGPAHVIISVIISAARG